MRVRRLVERPRVLRPAAPRHRVAPAARHASPPEFKSVGTLAGTLSDLAVFEPVNEGRVPVRPESLALPVGEYIRVVRLLQSARQWMRPGIPEHGLLVRLSHEEPGRGVRQDLRLGNPKCVAELPLRSALVGADVPRRVPLVAALASGGDQRLELWREGRYPLDGRPDLGPAHGPPDAAHSHSLHDLSLRA